MYFSGDASATAVHVAREIGILKTNVKILQLTSELRWIEVQSSSLETGGEDLSLENLPKEEDLVITGPSLAALVDKHPKVNTYKIF